jgi:hypothetical protein
MEYKPLRRYTLKNRTGYFGLPTAFRQTRAEFRPLLLNQVCHHFDID